MVKLSKAAPIAAALVVWLNPFASAEQRPLFAPENEGSEALKQIAIIGAGSAGASAAYYLNKYSTNNLNITIFEQSSYIGGRSITVDAFDDPTLPIELGASIFVKVNRNLVSAAERFNLVTRQAFNLRPKHSSYDVGIWNGQDFVYKQARGSSWWTDVTKLIWQYGLAPIRTQRLMKKAVGQFLQMYDKPHFPFADLSEAVANVGLLGFTSSTGRQVLDVNNIGSKFSNEIIQSATRVNYGQNLNQIHGLETMVCMATDGAMSIEGGNWQIFDRMAHASGARLRLNTTVSGIQRHDDKTYTLTYSSSYLDSDPSSANFDIVILAAPFHSSDLSIAPPLPSLPDKIPYVTLHVTLLTSPHRLAPSFFSLSDELDVPETILTTLSPETSPPANTNSSQAVGPTPFWSISTLASIPRSSPNEDTQNHYIYKIFSPSPLNSTFISSLLDFPLNPDPTTAADTDDIPLTSISKEHISWLHTKTWQAYPFEFPRVTFDKLLLDDHMLYYTGGIEPFISAMEASSLMGRNVAALIARKYKEEWYDEYEGGCATNKILREEKVKWEL
ncbi:MAG: hypothetical protein Q9227_005092 [Pyrenula ochraceoflavens]